MSLTFGYSISYLRHHSCVCVVCCNATHHEEIESEFGDFITAFGLGFKPKPMRRFRKLAYASGMISLIMLPMLCLPYIARHKIQFDRLRVLEILRTEGKQFLLPAILFTVMLGLLILKTRIVAVRAMKLKQPKILESPSDNPDV